MKDLSMEEAGHKLVGTNLQLWDLLWQVFFHCIVIVFRRNRILQSVIWWSCPGEILQWRFWPFSIRGWWLSQGLSKARCSRFGRLVATGPCRLCQAGRLFMHLPEYGLLVRIPDSQSTSIHWLVLVYSLCFIASTIFKHTQILESDASMNQHRETIWDNYLSELSKGFGLNSDEIYSLLLDAKAAGHRLLSLSDAWHQWRQRIYGPGADFHRKTFVPWDIWKLHLACPGPVFDVFASSSFWKWCHSTKDFLNMMRLGGLV